MTVRKIEFDAELAVNSAQMIGLELAESRWAHETTAALSDDERSAIGMSYVDFGSAMVWLTSNRPEKWLYNRTLALGLRRPVEEADLDKIIAAARAAGVSQLVCGVLPESLPTDLGARLIARGAKEGRAWLQLTRDAALPGTALIVPAAPIDVQEVDASGIDVFTDVLFKCFGLSGALLPLFHKTVGQPGWHYYVTLQDGIATACASLFLCEGFGFLGYAATREPFSRRGLQTALIERRIADARREGAHSLLAQVVESVAGNPNPSEKNLKRAGFTAAYRRRHFTLAISPSP